MDTLYWHSVFTRRTYIKLVVRQTPGANIWSSIFLKRNK